MANYRKRLESDLERWIEAGYITPERRGDILGSVPERRIEASAALGFAGAAMLGIAAIAFVMANWDQLPRFGRLFLILALLGGAIAGAAWAGDKRPGMQSGLALIAALIFAAGVGLVGQMFNLPGEPWYALAMTAFGALGLCWASGRAAPGVAAAAFAGMAHFTAGGDLFSGLNLADNGAPDLFLLAFVIGLISVALQLRHALLRNALLLLAGYASAVLIDRLAGLVPEDQRPSGYGRWQAAVFALGWAGLAAAAVWRKWKSAPAIAGYGAWFALIGSLFVCYDNLWLCVALLAISVAALAWARGERHAAVTSASVVGMIAAVCMILFNLGVDLMTIAGLFVLLAIPALIGAAVLARRRKAKAAT
jgi:MFS family permease